MNYNFLLNFIFLIIILGCTSKVKVNYVDTVINAHSHNDYEHARPLYDALNYKFKSIEADVFSKGDSLYLAHDFNQIKEGVTLRKIYLEPLKIIILKNNGYVYNDSIELILLIDIKDNGLKSYKLLHSILKEYEEIITSYCKNIKKKRAINIIVSGNRPLNYIQNQSLRFASFDGRIADLDAGLTPNIMPLISDNWQHYFKWNGTGNMPILEKNKLLRLVKNAHKKNYMLRFWNTPDNLPLNREAVWNELKKAGVDLIGSDHTKALHNFFLNRNDNDINNKNN